MEIWRKIGFSDGEGKVYEAILKLETPTLQKIHEATGIERRNVYDIINKLISKGLVTYVTENKKKVYHITHPNKILTYLEDRKQEIEISKKEFETTLPDLIRAYETNKEDVSIQIYRGLEGMKALYEDFLNYQDNYFIGANFAIKKYLANFWIKWNSRREEKEVFWHDILSQKTYDQQLPNYYKTEKMKHYEYKILPKEFGSPHFIVIYGNKVGNLMWESPFIAFTVENSLIAKNYMDYFNFLWKTLPKPK
ncbi:helix-turn-helix domain-containing protein [Candidatus Micrarchaeota archaeon]|nr:helix-turn-helix domain-containing protein [Candidatus Micrarchaeota archaeon]